MSVRILNGDCRDVLLTLPNDHFDCVCTSPPYWGLRSYLPEGHADKHLEIGLEPTLDAYVEQMVGVFDQLWRVLKPSGTAFLNLGDSYTTGASVSPRKSDPKAVSDVSGGVARRGTPDGLKPKDLCGVPWRVAFALQARGWWLRSAIVWHKPNPMPESVTDRPTSAYEMVFLLTKGERYFYDAEAIAEQGITGDMRRPYGSAGAWELDGRPSEQRPNGKPRKEKQRGHARRHDGFGDKWDSMSKAEQCSGTRNARNVWTIATQPFKGSHFATMPPDLAERCIKAGCPPKGSVLDPFGGAGTTGLVADRLGRHATLIEINPAYREMGAERIRGDAGMFADVGSP